MDPGKVKEYKAYSNKLNRIIHAAKKNYFSKQFELNKENIKCTWKLISKVIRTKKENTQHIACVASVSSRNSSRKLGQEQKKNE